MGMLVYICIYHLNQMVSHLWLDKYNLMIINFRFERPEHIKSIYIID